MNIPYRDYVCVVSFNYILLGLLIISAGVVYTFPKLTVKTLVSLGTQQLFEPFFCSFKNISF